MPSRAHVGVSWRECDPMVDVEPPTPKELAAIAAAIKAAEAIGERKSGPEWLLFDSAEQYDGLERLIVIAVGLDALVADGVDAQELRGVALLALGCLHIFGPMAKSFIPSWATGRLDRASVSTGIERLRTLYDEDGLYAPLALAVMVIEKFLLKRVLSFAPLTQEDVSGIESKVDEFDARCPGSFMGIMLRIPILNHYQQTFEATALVACYRTSPEAQNVAPAILLSLTTYNTR